MDKDELQLPLARPRRLRRLNMPHLGHFGHLRRPLLQHYLIKSPPDSLRAFSMQACTFDDNTQSHTEGKGHTHNWLGSSVFALLRGIMPEHRLLLTSISRLKGVILAKRCKSFCRDQMVLALFPLGVDHDAGSATTHTAPSEHNLLSEKKWPCHLCQILSTAAKSWLRQS